MTSKQTIVLSLLLLAFLSVGVSGATNPFNSSTDITATFNKTLNGVMDYSMITGYIPIDWYFPKSNSSLFYQFATKRGQVFPNTISPYTPLLFWFNGGPGSSSQIGSWQEMGPWGARYVSPDGQFGNTTVFQRAYAWNEAAHIVFIDQPLNVGWSYSNEPGLEVNNSQTASDHLNNFVYNFYLRYPQLMSNPLYLTGESYGGHYVPCFAYGLLNNANISALFLKKGTPFNQTFRGIAVGDGLAVMENQEQYFDTYYYSIGLASNQMRDTLLQREINGQNIFRSYPLNGTAAFNNFWNTGAPSDNDFGGVSIYNFNEYPDPPFFSEELFQNAAFRTAYGIPDGVLFGKNNGGSEDMAYWFRQDESEPYDYYYKYLLESMYKVLVYMGQNDIIINQPAAMDWVNNLDWIWINFWQDATQTIWTMPNNQGQNTTVGSYQVAINFCFATIYDAGHLVPTDQPIVALSMLNQYLSWNFQPAPTKGEVTKKIQNQYQYVKDTRSQQNSNNNNSK